jgi:hypothetical protein
MKWFRFWTDTVNDVKILQLTDYEYRIWTYLLCYASEVNTLSGELQTTFKLLSLHFHQRFNLFSRAIETFHKLGMITVSEDGYVTITNWSKRQFKSDDSYARVKKYREVNQKRNVSMTVSETAPDTDTDTDTEKDKTIKKQKIIFEDRKFKNIPEELIEKWKQVSPGIDVIKEISKAELWVISNPEKKRSKWTSFLSNWMIKAQDNFIKYGGNANGKGTTKYRTDIRGQVVPDESEAINARYYARKAAEESARNKAGGASGNDDAPDFESQ